MDGEFMEMDMDMDMDLSLHELSKPVKEVEEKWKLLPHFLRMRGSCNRIISNSIFINNCI
jgi:hypothetical protein